mmetsp:Transcript_17489/g.23585  ORF Transcript_17489/g.23585 Transcript_17489/m.23585 type:complete len:501 (-) Transcript_17489:218-1720(-)
MDELLVALTQLTQECREKDEAGMEHLRGARVVFSTLASATSLHLLRPLYEIILVDEAAQATEVEVLPVLGLGCRRLLLCGDPQQLPATTFSQAAAAALYARSMMERLTNAGYPSRLLDTQYRMDPQIALWPSEYFYKGKLLTAKGTGSCSAWAKDHPSEPSAVALRDRVFGGGLVWVDVVGPEVVCRATRSLMNPNEAQLVTHLVDWLTSYAMVPSHEIVVISSYAAQVRLLRKQLSSSSKSNPVLANIGCHTVDSFQGSEASVVVLSLVRSNQDGRVGFLDEPRRLNVALTRAKDLCIVCGDSHTLASSAAETVVTLVGHVTGRGLLRKAADLKATLVKEMIRTTNQTHRHSEEECMDRQGTGRGRHLESESEPCVEQNSIHYRRSTKPLSQKSKQRMATPEKNSQSQCAIRVTGDDVYTHRIVVVAGGIRKRKRKGGHAPPCSTTGKRKACCRSRGLWLSATPASVLGNHRLLLRKGRYLRRCRAKRTSELKSTSEES